MSTETMPGSCVSAANMLRRKRICWICSFGGSRPPRKPFTRRTAPGPAMSLQRLLHLVGVVRQFVDLRLARAPSRTRRCADRSRARAGRGRPAPFRRASRSPASPRAGCRPARSADVADARPARTRATRRGWCSGRARARSNAASPRAPVSTTPPSRRRRQADLRADDHRAARIDDGDPQRRVGARRCAIASARPARRSTQTIRRSSCLLARPVRSTRPVRRPTLANPTHLPRPPCPTWPRTCPA